MSREWSWWRFRAGYDAKSPHDWNAWLCVLPFVWQVASCPGVHTSVAVVGSWGYASLGVGTASGRGSSGAGEHGGRVWTCWPFYASHWRRP